MSETETHQWVARLVVSIRADQPNGEPIQIALAVKQQNLVVLDPVGGMIPTSAAGSAQEAVCSSVPAFSSKSRGRIELEELPAFRETSEEPALFTSTESMHRDVHTNGNRATASVRLTALSPREREVAMLLASGYANVNIAARLGVSENTVRTYVRRLYRKLGICTRVDLTRIVSLAPSAEQALEG